MTDSRGRYRHGPTPSINPWLRLLAAFMLSMLGGAIGATVVWILFVFFQGAFCG